MSWFGGGEGGGQSGQGGGWMQSIMPLLAVGANAIASGGPKRQYKYNKRMAAYQNALNRENAEWAFNKELELRKYQAEYDSPAAMMQRFKDAGLNPNLVYGHGTAAAGSFEAPSAPNVPAVGTYQIDAASLGNIGTQFMQARLMSEQADLTQAKTDESTVKQDLIKAQEAVAKANPHLRPEYLDALVINLKSIAQLKEQEARFNLSETIPGFVPGQDVRWERGFLKMQTELSTLEKKFNLMSADQKIKAEILESKEFQNALQEIQVKWMQDAEITPQHIYQGIFMLLQSLMRR